jgi:hypothetical protein
MPRSIVRRAAADGAAGAVIVLRRRVEASPLTGIDLGRIFHIRRLSPRFR